MLEKNKKELRVSIVIPVYKLYNELLEHEILLLKKIQNVFSTLSIIIILPKSLEKNWRENCVFNLIAFDDFFFKDKDTYSLLLSNKIFYQAFHSFDYIQIIQTDCWVFENNLEYFCNLGFDYIGAPWMEGGFEGKPLKKLWKVGNGGFSLRKVKTFLNILDEIKNTNKGKLPVFKDLHSGVLRFLKNIGVRNNLRHYLKKTPGEDIFWCIYIPHIFNQDEFKIADLKTAASYSFEVHPEYLYNEITYKKLPMGCHNWLQHDKSFWEQYIKY